MTPTPGSFDGIIFANEIKAFFLAPYFDDAAERIGEEELSRIVTERFGVQLDALRDKNAWVSLEFVEDLIALLMPENEPAYFHRMGRAAFSSRYLGFLRPILRAFGSPQYGYRSLQESLARFSKIGTGAVVGSTPTSVTIEYRPTPDAPQESSRNVCQGRRGQLEALPTLFDLPPALLVHTECIHDGHPACVYEISHRPMRSRVRPLVSLFLGVVVGGALAYALAAPAAIVAAVSALVGGAFWAIANSFELRRALQEHTGVIGEQHDALSDSAAANEARFAELTEAKAAVERKVEERTAELQRTTDALEETLGEVEALSQARTDFFANMSHELRTPLTLIMAPLAHLAAGKEPPGGSPAALTAMLRNADRLLRMINQLLDLARVESGSASVERAPVLPAALLSEVVLAFTAAATAKGVSLELVTEKSDSTLSLDSKWLETALTNLVGNSLKFCGPGDLIRLSAEDRGDELILEVRDTGPGIAPDRLDSLFERFSRGTGRGAGTGIGLSLVHEAARLHEGRVEVESVLGDGAVFRLCLPRLLARGPAITHAIPTRSVVDDDCPSRPGPSLAAPFALVVEDNPDVRRFIVDVLAVTYRVRSTRNGREALNVIADERPDILVSDISMPKMNGLELSRALRDDASSRDIPIILVTARGESAQILEGFDAGADDYVVKPFHGRELIARASALVRARRMAGRLVHQERLATVGVVAASVAHHIRNPLNALIGGLPAVRSRLGHTFDEPTHKMFDVFIDCAERIENVTTDLLDLSRVDGPKRCTFPPGRGLAASVRLMETRFGDAISIDRSIDEETTIIGYAGELHHVFLNLLDNAARATGNDGHLRVVGRLDGEWYEVSVADDGPGIPPELIARIFEPFVTTREAGEGTGLGLAIAQDVVRQHGGTIEAGASSLGGAEVKIRLPVAC